MVGLDGLIAATLLLAALTPWAAKRRWPGLTLGGFMVLNAAGHFAGSLNRGRLMPAVLSSPLLLAAGLYLMPTSSRTGRTAISMGCCGSD
jgi:hypothetical protein